MTSGRKIVMTGAAGLAVAAIAAAAWAQTPKAPPVVRSPEVNMCRSSCGDAWVNARSCADEAAVCLRRADRAYKQCLPDCDTGQSPMTGAFAYMMAKPPPATTRRATTKRRGDGPDSTAARPWVDARTRWEALPDRTQASLPATFPLPPSAFGYAGITSEIRSFAFLAPSLLKVELVVAKGQVGVSLATPGGSAMVSQEAVLKPSPEVQAVYFQIGPETPAVSVLVRNRDRGGAPGSVTVRAVTFARTAVLPADEAMRLGALK